MLFSLNLIEILPLYAINIFLFLIFFATLVLGYPVGGYFLAKHCDNSLIKYSLFSIVIFATIISIVINLTPIFAKYVIFIFYLINLFILVTSSKIRNDLFKAVISFKFVLLATFLIFLILNIIYNRIFIESDKLVYFFDSHDSFYIGPIAEILTADYFSRIKIFSHYPLEWSSYHFFEASFNSIFLLPIYQLGIIGLNILKNFYLSIFLSLFFFSFFKNESFKKEEFLQIILKAFLVILLFILLSPQITYFILTKNFISTLSIIFIIQSLLSKNRNDFLIWAIILSLSSFRNSFISLMLIVYYLIEIKDFNFTNIINKIQKSLNLPNLILVTLFLFYLISTFYQSETVNEKFNLLGNRPIWWTGTTTYNVLANYKYFIVTLILLIVIYLFSLKYFFDEKLDIVSHFKKQDFYHFSSILIIPFICIILLIFKNHIIDIYNIEKLVIFFNSFNLTNLYYYFFPPLIWCLILFCSEIKARYIFIIAITAYTFLSIFIYNNIIMPAFFTLEIMILFFVSHNLLEFENINRKKTLCYLFMASVIIFGVFNSNIYYRSVTEYNYNTGKKFTYTIKDLKELKKKEYICPQDIKYISSNKHAGEALSVILFKPYYSNILIEDKYDNWDKISFRYAVSPKQQVGNPCRSE